MNSAIIARNHQTAVMSYRARQGGFISMQQKRRMIRTARLRAIHSESGRCCYPLEGKCTLYSCFTRQDDRIILWYNDSTGNSHVVMENRIWHL